MKHFGVDPGIIAGSLDPGQYIDFVTLRVRNSGVSRMYFAKSHHAFVEAIQLDHAT
ncbi:MAG: hypothetical protein RXR02_00610 [Thermoproteus sp.]